MITDKKVLGLIFSNMHDDTISDLTFSRTMGSVLFGARYRLIDFPLSNMVNSGIGEVGVITKSNYQSLLDHLGSGREWDLARKKGGLHLLPPFSHVTSGMYKGRLEALFGVWNFIKHSDADYVLLSDCDVVSNMDYSKVIDFHIETGADITCVCAPLAATAAEAQRSTVFGINSENRIIEVLISPHMSGSMNVCLNVFVMSKEFLKNIILEANSKGLIDFEKSTLQSRTGDYRIMAYNYEGYFRKISSMETFYNANMDLLKKESRDGLFLPHKPVYTKVRDNPPAKYAIGASVRNSLIGDGCIIEGTVENCIIFRGVKIGKDAKVKNSIIMQNTSIGKKCDINCVITDKDVNISDMRALTGSANYPLYLGKRASI